VRIKGKYRGFTGHEHLTEWDVINMNGRIYDPTIGQFMQPDNFIQAPDDPYSYNRFTYCMNNPLKYSDPSGEIGDSVKIEVECWEKQRNNKNSKIDWQFRNEDASIKLKRLYPSITD